MRRFLPFILPCILAACAATATPNPKLIALTAEAEAQTNGYPANDATVTAIIATKSAGGTAMAATMTAQPTGTPIPTIPPDSRPCRPTDLKSASASNGATGHILLGAQFTNISNAPCYLQTWPQVILVDAAGRPFDVDYHYFDITSATPNAAATEQAQYSAAARTGLWPGWTAGFNLIWDNWCQSAIPGGAVIRLTLADGNTINVPTDVQSGGRCDAPGGRSTVGISPFGYIFQSP